MTRSQEKRALPLTHEDRRIFRRIGSLVNGNVVLHWEDRASDLQHADRRDAEIFGGSS